MGTSLADLQKDLRMGYASGAPGVLASALAWGAAAGTAAFVDAERAVWVLFVGGALIHPVGVLLCKLFGVRGAHTRGNPLGMLAGAITIWLILSLPLAYVVSRVRLDWFFPAMLLVIGGRYLVFDTLYGLRAYFVLGIALAAAGVALVMFRASPAVAAATGSAIELAFAIYFTRVHRREARLVTASA